MLTVYSGGNGRDCQGNSRRDFLRAGFLGVGGLSLPWLLQQKAQAAAGTAGYVKDKAGEATKNPDLEAEGEAQRAGGEAQEMVGKARRKAGETVVALANWPGHLPLVLGNGGLTTQAGSAAAGC